MAETVADYRGNYSYNFLTTDDVDLRNFDADTGSIADHGPMTVERHFLLDHFRRGEKHLFVERPPDQLQAERQPLGRQSRRHRDPGETRELSAARPEVLRWLSDGTRVHNVDWTINGNGGINGIPVKLVIEDEQGNLVGVIGISFDISGLRVQATLRRTAAPAARAMLNGWRVLNSSTSHCTFMALPGSVRPAPVRVLDQYYCLDRQRDISSAQPPGQAYD